MIGWKEWRAVEGAGSSRRVRRKPWKGQIGANPMKADKYGIKGRVSSSVVF